MTTSLDTTRTARTLLVIAAVFVATSFALWSPARGVATAVGAGLSLLNWAALRWFGARILSNAGEGGTSSGMKAAVSFLLIAKIGLLMGLVYVLIHRMELDPIGLAFGFGVLFVGPVAASFVAVAARPLSPSAAGAAREER